MSKMEAGLGEPRDMGDRLGALEAVDRISGATGQGNLRALARGPSSERVTETAEENARFRPPPGALSTKIVVRANEIENRVSLKRDRMDRKDGWPILLLLLVACGCNFGPSTAQQMEQGQLLYDAKQFAEARQVYETALETCNNAADRATLHTLVGSCDMELEDYQTALVSLNKALEIRPDYPAALNNCGICYRSLGENAKARESYHKSIAADPKYPNAHSSLATLLLLEGEYQEAIDHFERALQLDNSLAVTHGNLALAYAKVGRFAEADASLKASIERGYVNAEIMREQIEELKANQGKSTP
jgi:tetratricopeptide (TPR) repeat protein